MKSLIFLIPRFKHRQLTVINYFCVHVFVNNILYRGPPIDANYQVSVQLAKWFQRSRLKCEKLTEDGCQVMAKAHFAFGKVS
jgi:hypothetical protein